MRSALRLRRPSDFSRVRRAGKTYRHPKLLMTVARGHLPRNRYGFIVSRKIGPAVRRNSCKRRLRSIMGILHECLKQGYDIVIIARSNLPSQPFRELQRIVSGLLKQARLLGVCETC